MEQKRILAIDLAPCGFGYAVLEDPTTLVDWGVKKPQRHRNRDENVLKNIRAVAAQFTPEAVIIEDPRNSRRSAHSRRLLRAISRMFGQDQLHVFEFSRAEIRRAFEPFKAQTKFQISHILACYLPELKDRLPRFRKPWMAEDERIHIFNAISLAYAFYHHDK